MLCCSTQLISVFSEGDPATPDKDVPTVKVENGIRYELVKGLDAAGFTVFKWKTALEVQVDKLQDEKVNFILTCRLSSHYTFSY